MSRGDPLESNQSLENRTPKRTSWLQPPHSQVSCNVVTSSGKGLRRLTGWDERRLAGRPPLSEPNSGVFSPAPAMDTPLLWKVWSWSWVNLRRILSSSRWRLASQPHPRNLPRLQAEATECTTPAASSDSEKALSRKPGMKESTFKDDNRNHKTAILGW